MARITSLAIAALVTVGACAVSVSARADCKWPQLNAQESSESYPVRVGNAIFTTGYWSWYVPQYRIDSLHCSKTIDMGPRHWWVMVGLGGPEPIGPRFGTDATTGQDRQPAPASAVNQAGAALSPLPQVNSLAPLTTLAPLSGQSTSMSSLPNLDALPPLPR
jgi:hypothetical protein